MEVSNKASNAACRGELGRFPLIVGINEKILNYIMYLFEKDGDSIVKQALLLSTPVSIKVASVMHDARSLFHRPQRIMFAINTCVDHFFR